MKRKIPYLAFVLLFSTIANACSVDSECDHIDNDRDHICDNCFVKISQHEDISPKDHECDICGFILSSHEDNNCDHLCDICGNVFTNHIDNNYDHICDECELRINECLDDNTDHRCDICGKILTDHVDSDFDYYCDICSKFMNENLPTIYFSSSITEMTVGQSYQFKTYIIGGNENNKIVWSVDNPNVISVNDNGYVYALSEGDATLTATLDILESVSVSLDIHIEREGWNNETKNLMLDVLGCVVPIFNGNFTWKNDKSTPQTLKCSCDTEVDYQSARNFLVSNAYFAFDYSGKEVFYITEAVNSTESMYFLMNQEIKEISVFVAKTIKTSWPTSDINEFLNPYNDALEKMPEGDGEKFLVRNANNNSTSTGACNIYVVGQMMNYINLLERNHWTKNSDQESPYVLTSMFSTLLATLEQLSDNLFSIKVLRKQTAELISDAWPSEQIVKFLGMKTQFLPVFNAKNFTVCNSSLDGYIVKIQGYTYSDEQYKNALSNAGYRCDSEIGESYYFNEELGIKLNFSNFLLTLDIKILKSEKEEDWEQNVNVKIKKITKEVLPYIEYDTYEIKDWDETKEIIIGHIYLKGITMNDYETSLTKNDFTKYDTEDVRQNRFVKNKLGVGLSIDGDAIVLEIFNVKLWDAEKVKNDLSKWTSIEIPESNGLYISAAKGYTSDLNIYKIKIAFGSVDEYINKCCEADFKHQFVDGVEDHALTKGNLKLIVIPNAEILGFDVIVYLNSFTWDEELINDFFKDVSDGKSVPSPQAESYVYDTKNGQKIKVFAYGLNMFEYKQKLLDNGFITFNDENDSEVCRLYYGGIFIYLSAENLYSIISLSYNELAAKTWPQAMITQYVENITSVTVPIIDGYSYEFLRDSTNNCIGCMRVVRADVDGFITKLKEAGFFGGYNERLQSYVYEKNTLRITFNVKSDILFVNFYKVVLLESQWNTLVVDSIVKKAFIVTYASHELAIPKAEGTGFRISQNGFISSYLSSFIKIEVNNGDIDEYTSALISAGFAAPFYDKYSGCWCAQKHELRIYYRMEDDNVMMIYGRKTEEPMMFFDDYRIKNNFNSKIINPACKFITREEQFLKDEHDYYLCRFMVVGGDFEQYIEELRYSGYTVIESNRFSLHIVAMLGDVRIDVYDAGKHCFFVGFRNNNNDYEAFPKEQLQEILNENVRVPIPECCGTHFEIFEVHTNSEVALFADNETLEDYYEILISNGFVGHNYNTYAWLNYENLKVYLEQEDGYIKIIYVDTLQSSWETWPYYQLQRIYEGREEFAIPEFDGEGFKPYSRAGLLLYLMVDKADYENVLQTMIDNGYELKEDEDGVAYLEKTGLILQIYHNNDERLELLQLENNNFPRNEIENWINRKQLESPYTLYDFYGINFEIIYSALNAIDVYAIITSKYEFIEYIQEYIDAGFTCVATSDNSYLIDISGDGKVTMAVECSDYLDMFMIMSLNIVLPFQAF